MKITIIGGGIIGLCSAWFLQLDGHEVTVIEQGDLTNNCSFGNMGYLSPSHLVPLAAPGMIEQGIFWMFDQKSPFYIRPNFSWRLVDWGWKFFQASTQKHVENSAKPLADLMLLSKSIFESWAKDGQMQFELTQSGCIMWYKTAKKEKAEIETARQAETFGMSVEMITPEQAQTLEPELAPDVAGGVWYKTDAHLDPNALMTQLPALLEKRGVKILKNTKITGFEQQNGQIKAIFTENTNTPSIEKQRLDTEMVVLAAGSWSPEIAKLAGEYLPLLPGKGYSMTVNRPQKRLYHPCIFLEAKVALTPWRERLRIGSTMEIGEMDDRILFPRVQGILEAVPKFMPGYLEDAVFRDLADLTKLKQHLRERVWFGYRPVSPDGMPYIGFAKKTNNLVMASGHAMLGISMATGTGQLIAELISGNKTSINLKAFDPKRY